MAARKRKTGESFEAYRENLKAEERAIRQQLRGAYFYRSDAHRDSTNTRIPYRRERDE